MSDTLKRAAAMLLAEANAIEDCHTRGDGDWTGEDEAKASHDAMREVAILLGEEAERMAEQAFFLKAAQAESERYCEQRDNLLRVLQHITCEPINAEYMAQEAIDAIVADEINEANGGAVCRVTANAEITGCRKAVRLIEELGVRVMYDATDENAEEEWNMRQAADEYDELMDEIINYHKADAKKWAEQAMQLWQPIETAPKDGRYLMVGNEDGVWIASYCATFQSGFKPDNPWISLMLNHRHIEKVKRNYSRVPTHWMPLPRSPKVDGSNAAIPNVEGQQEPRQGRSAAP